MKELSAINLNEESGNIISQRTKDYLSKIKISAKSLLMILNDSLDVSNENTETPKTQQNTDNSADSSEKPFFDGEILVCEDNNFDKDVICDHLAKAGQIKVTIANNGKAGVDLVKERIETGHKSFDLIFMDINMPEMDGIEAAKKILEMGSRVPIIALTANTKPDDKKTYFASGMVDCLPKPFSAHELWSCLLKYLNPVNMSAINDDKTEIQAYDNKNACCNQARNGASMSTNQKILIVDDEKMNIMSLAQFLKPNYDIIVATDGVTALEAAVKHIPDIILLDILMPDMSGFEVLIKLKDAAETMNIPVIFITGLNNAADEEKGLSLGAVDYITKPFNQTIVKARIKAQLKMAHYIKTIEKLCMMDALTGLPNRRGFDTRIEAEWGRAFREKKPLGLIMLDIDNFKSYNDTYGHPQGDNLLQAIAEILNKTLNRSSDIAVRWGGEEFCILLPDTDLTGTYNIAEQIRINVMEAAFTCPTERSTNMTVSLGACSKIPGENDSMADYISEVDKLLYNAKEKGKNITCTVEEIK